MNLVRNLKETFEELKELFPKVPDAELLKVAAQMQNTQALRDAFLLDWKGEMSALEAIGSVLGKKPASQSYAQRDLPDLLGEMTEVFAIRLDAIKEAIEQKKDK